MRGAIFPLPNTPSWRGAQLKHRDSFIFIEFFYCSHPCSVNKYLSGYKMKVKHNETGSGKENESSSSTEMVCNRAVCRKYHT
jgi:hypothetical protein